MKEQIAAFFFEVLFGGHHFGEGSAGGTVETGDHGLMAKKCNLCGRYFVSKDKRNRKYCNRIYEGNKTCKDIGAKLLYKEKTEDDPYLARYEDLRQAYYSRKYRADSKRPNTLSGKDMTDAEYVVWSEMAVQERQRYLAGEISGEDLIATLTQRE